MQLTSSRIWTRVALTISCEDNHETTDTPYGLRCKNTYFIQKSVYINNIKLLFGLDWLFLLHDNPYWVI